MSTSAQQSVFAIMLAAGAASRFGSTKQLAKLHGVPLVRHACMLANSCCQARSVLVAGHDWRAVADACAPLPGYLIVNDNYASGIASSIALAVTAVRHAAHAVLVLLADQPMISVTHLQALMAAWSGDEQEIVATSYAGVSGAPALFARGCFDSLAALRGDQGARALFGDARFTVREIAYEAAAIDIDTVDDLLRLERNARS
jgi:molybdenum cofactor cytidylyltransferase